MFKKGVLVLLLFSLSLVGANISKEQCGKMGENFIFAGGECIQYVHFEGEVKETLTVVVHGTWDAGTNTLGRYAPFAENLAMATDITTVAVALPGYSKSSTNNFPALKHEGKMNFSTDTKYINFLGDLVEGLKKKFKAKKVNYMGHSAGATMGATLTGLRSGLVNNIALAGGRYTNDKGLKEATYFKDVMKSADKNTNYLFIYGTEDKISEPIVSTSFFKEAIKGGLKAKLVKVEGAAHLDLDMTDASIDSFTEMVEE